MLRETRIAIVGAGLAGLCLAALLHRKGFRVRLFEQAPRFWRVGAGIIMGATIAKVMGRLGVLDRYLGAGIRPDAFVSRNFNDGAILNELVFDPRYVERVGPFVNIHRADLHAILHGILPDDAIRYEARLSGLENSAGAMRLRFEDGHVEEADMVVGADGIRSTVREATFGPRAVRYCGRVALRAVYPAARAAGVPMRDCTKWWGPRSHALTYYMTPRRDEIYIMGAVENADWTAETPPVTKGPEDFLAAFAEYHPDLRGLIAAAAAVTTLPICELERNDSWSHEAVTLIGDACHAVRPFMAAGGSMAIEDAAVLSEAIVAHDTPQAAYGAYEAVRIPRVGEVQRISSENSWMRTPGDTDWFFGYDPFAEDMNAARRQHGDTRHVSSQA